MIIYTNSNLPLSENMLPINAFDIRLYEEKAASYKLPPDRWSDYCLVWRLYNPKVYVNPVKFQCLLYLINKIVIHDRYNTTFEESVKTMLNEIDDLPIKSYLMDAIFKIPIRQYVSRSQHYKNTNTQPLHDVILEPIFSSDSRYK